MINFNQVRANCSVLFVSLLITSWLFLPPLFDSKYQDTLYPYLALPFACFVFFCFIFGCRFGGRILRNKSFITPHFFSELGQTKSQNSSEKKILLLAWVVAAAFFCLYLVVGWIMLANTGVPGNPNLDFFGADIQDWTGLQYARDGYKPAHTNILLIVQPLEQLLGFIPAPSLVLAITLNSFFSAVNVFLASVLFWQLTRQYLSTFLLTLLLGLSTSYLVFGSIPESYTLGSCSLMTTYILFLNCLKTKDMKLELWILAGIFSFGITITNFAQTLICFAIALFAIHKESTNRDYLSTIAEYTGSVVSCSIILSLIQNHFYGSDYFFMPNMLVYETKEFITKINLFTNPLLVLKELFKHFFLVNIVSPWPSIIDSYLYQDVRQLSFFSVPLSYSHLGLLAAGLWGYIFVFGAYKNLVSCLAKGYRDRTLFLAAVSLSILYNLIFHSLYGTTEMFIYTCYFTFLVIVLSVANEALKRTSFKLILGILISVMAINNLEILLSFKNYSFIP